MILCRTGGSRYGAPGKRYSMKTAVVPARYGAGHGRMQWGLGG